MSAPRPPSLITLLNTSSRSSPPVCDWLQLIRSESDLIDLLVSVQGIPLQWLKWADTKTLKMEKRYRHIDSRVGYSLTALWNGITYLQECKFLCDIFENSLRAAFTHFVTSNQIRYRQLYPKRHLDEMKRTKKYIHERLDAPIAHGFVFETSFEELSKTISLNWKMVAPLTSRGKAVIGLNSLFWSETNLRDVNKFDSDMAEIRKYRNDIAHSKRLFDFDDVLKLNTLICRWLKPLNVELMYKVNSYRRNRPRFLQDLERINRLRMEPKN